MTLTEEQRAALKRVAAYMDEMYSVASPYHGCTEDANLLRAMIDSSGTVEPTGGFDLEAARAADEALPYPLDANEIWVSGKGQMHINPPNAPSIFFTLSDLCEFRNLFHGQAAEIERLRPFEIAARDLDSDLTKIAGERDDQAARIKELEADLEQAERVIEARSEVIDPQAALTKSLKKEIRRLKHESKVEQEFTNSYILHLHEAEARIKELEADNQNLVTMNKALMKNDWILRDNNRKYRKRSQKAELLNKSLKSKIGPDARPPCWQITEERKETLRRALEEYKIFPNDQAVLRAMLREAE